MSWARRAPKASDERSNDGLWLTDASRMAEEARQSGLHAGPDSALPACCCAIHSPPALLRRSSRYGYSEDLRRESRWFRNRIAVGLPLMEWPCAWNRSRSS